MNRILFIVIVFLLVMSINGCSNETFKETKESWEESPTLVKEVIVTDDGQTDEFIYRIGDNGKLGFGEYGPFKAGETQKYMWHFWGKQETLTQPFKVIGINKESGEELTVFEFSTNSSLAPNNGADHHIPSMMTLPSAGIWKLEVYFGEGIFGHVIVNVKDD
ncbi:hypothetical protein [Metabacillus malikii]|uniref:DUF4871 domain-containing protein n=1 Tax=Metabacillus malikii TaxID=1504265 RepID=A0ABT9ZJX2_9BACI|nr:hypothetical protein [Metabacillus malikii]MDQ0232591.1 hypothetical protein [Metabacillus malikii]